MFEVKEQFYYDEKPYQIISGGLHYFRIPREYWDDRLMKLKAMGANTVETYVAWNLHEPQKGQFDFTGVLDLDAFLTKSEELGFKIILRPSPYICAEWEFGGLPWWLTNDDNCIVRSHEGSFLQHVKEYYEVLFQIIRPHLCTNGGGIILVQIENEYGYYGYDKKYLLALQDMMTELDCNVPYVTSDGPWGDAIVKGSVDNALVTINCGSDIEKQFEVLKGHIGNRPLMVMEFWIGWFDYWGSEKHSRSDLEQNKRDLSYCLKNGNLNFYMFCGGTNFGFMNGSNYYDNLQPDVTSYDYDAILTEWGDITPKYIAFKEMIEKHTNKKAEIIPANLPKKSYGTLRLKQRASLIKNLQILSKPTAVKQPVNMEKLGCGYGYILYKTVINEDIYIENIWLHDTADRAIIYLDGVKLLTLYDKELQLDHVIHKSAHKGSVLHILVENMGRVNFGEHLNQPKKGICGGVEIDGMFIYDWECYPLSLADVTSLFYDNDKTDMPTLSCFELYCDICEDTFLDMSDFGKGVVFINGFNIGRYWEKPQKRLYIPAPFLKLGRNEILVFETEGIVSDSITFFDTADIG